MGDSCSEQSGESGLGLRWRWDAQEQRAGIRKLGLQEMLHQDRTAGKRPRDEAVREQEETTMRSSPESAHTEHTAQTHGPGRKESRIQRGERNPRREETPPGLSPLT